MAFVVIFFAALELRNLVNAFINPTQSFVVAVLWLLVITIPIYGAWHKKVGRPYTQWMREHPTNKKALRYYPLPLLTLILVFFLYVGYGYFSQPVSFTATNFHFITNNGAIQVQASVTDTSETGIVQLNVAIDGIGDGVCGYSFATGHPTTCVFDNSVYSKPLVNCAQLPQVQNHSVTINAYFANTKSLTNSYSFTSAELGCT